MRELHRATLLNVAQYQQVDHEMLQGYRHTGLGNAGDAWFASPALETAPQLTPRGPRRRVRLKLSPPCYVPPVSRQDCIPYVRAGRVRYTSDRKRELAWLCSVPPVSRQAQPVERTAQSVSGPLLRSMSAWVPASSPLPARARSMLACCSPARDQRAREPGSAASLLEQIARAASSPAEQKFQPSAL